MDLRSLPDIVLINIFKHLDLGDLVHVAKVDGRIQSLCYDRTVVRNISLKHQYFIREEDVRELVEHNGHLIERLNLNHVYWLPQRLIQWTIGKCVKKLRSLHVLECKLKVQTLVNLISACPRLQELSFSLSSFTDIKKEVFASAQGTLSNLRMLRVYYTSREMTLMNYFGEHTTLLDYCDHLEELHVGSAGMAIPELYLPLVSQPHKHTHLRVMRITSNIHAGAQMLFYSTLSQLPHSHLSWQTLLMPNVNLTEFIKKPEFRACLRNLSGLRDLDVSGSKVAFPNEALDMTTAINLQHLCISRTTVTSDQLKHIATNCSKLVSVNLFGCSYIFQGRDGLDFSGLESVFESCRGLRHLNLGGEHHHLFLLPETEFVEITRVFSKMKGLHSLCIPVCLLCEAGQVSVRSGKRQAASPKGQTLKRRCLEGHVAPASSDSSPDSSPSNRSANSSPTRASCSGSSASGAAAADRQVSVLPMIVKNNPDLEVLEVIAVNFVSAIHKNRRIIPKTQQFAPCNETRMIFDDSLEAISKLPKLRSLTLVGAPGLVSGQCLVSIAKGCRQLERLVVGYLGGAMYGNIFSQALHHLTNLKDLRVEQPHLYMNPAFFEGLRHCRQLERLCILAKHSSFYVQDVSRLVEHLPRLVVVQIFANGTITACKNLCTSLQRKLGKTRPALSITIYPLLYDGMTDVIKTIPAQHFEDITHFQSLVGSLPPDR